MKNDGFREIGEWYINKEGRLDVDLPSSLENVPGIIAIVVNNEPKYLGSSSHYGPRIRDFKHSLTGEKTKTRIHYNMIDALNKKNKVTLLVLDTTNYRQIKMELIHKYKPSWNLQSL